MQAAKLLLLATALAATIAAAGAAAQDDQHGQHHPDAAPAAEQPMASQGGGMAGMHGGDMRAAMDRMHQAMGMSMTGDPDADFARMIPHHQGAIDMARAQLAQGKDPKLRAMARDIIKAQEGEIATLKAWLAEHPN